MSETVYAVVDPAGNVVNTIVADAEFVASLPGLIADETVETGALTADLRYFDVTTKSPRPGPGWTRASTGKFSPPPEPDPVPVEPAPEPLPDVEFVADAATRLADGESLTQDERDRLLAIDLATRLGAP